MVVRSIRTKLGIVENSYCNKQLRNTTMERRRISLTCSVLWIISTVLPVCGQIGVTICACQPSVYTFTFNFSATCDISTVEGPGVLDADCFARGFAIGSADDVNDTVPVQVTTVSIIELNKDLGVLVQTSYTDVFRDGDNFTYTSILSTPDNITGLTPDMVPGGIQLGIVGVNQMEIPITNVWIILFDNECGIFPVLEVGDQIGWTILSDLKEPLQSVCPLAPPPTLPTLTPTESTSRPTINPAASTSEEPSATPTFLPSAVPTPSCPPIRRNINNDTAALSLEHVREPRLHHFYDPLQYDARGRGVGTNSPVLPPLECPEMNMTIPDKTEDVPLKDSNTKPILEKKTKSRKEKKDKLQRLKGGTTSNKMPKVDEHDSDDDLLFIEIANPSTNTSETPVVVVSTNESDTSFGYISTQSPALPDSFEEPPPSNAPTTTYERLETQFEIHREDGQNMNHGGDSTTTIQQHTTRTMKEKNKKRSRL